MLRIIIYFIKLFIFLLLFFLFGRIFYLFYNYSKFSDYSSFHILLSNVYALPLDISIICYLLIFILSLIIFYQFVEFEVIPKLINLILFIFIIGNSIIILADTNLVNSWGTKINAKALSYLFFPELMNQALLTLNYWSILLIILTSFLFFKFYNRFLKINSIPKLTRNQNIWFIPFICILIIGMRGGIGTYPINKGRWMYSDNPTLNLATVNGLWNFASILFSKQKKEYHYLDQTEANHWVETYTRAPLDTTTKLLTTSRPNIVIILLESFSGENLVALGAKESNAPNLDSLMPYGVLFSNYFSTGTRTEQGIVSLFNGFPSQPKYSVQREGAILYNLPNLCKVLKEVGYRLNYYYSGGLEYARTDEYLKASQFDLIYDRNDFDNYKKYSTGASDEDLFSFFLNKQESDTIPFLSVMLTTSTHEPWEGPFRDNVKDKSKASYYKAAVNYSDQFLAKFLNISKTKSWYSNTLFVIVADHAHHFPYNRNYNEPLRFKIPMLWLGETIKNEFRGVNIYKPYSQIDFPATLLAQLNVDYSEFQFSKNILNPYSPSFSFYTFDDGFGVVSERDTVVYNIDQNKSFNSLSHTHNDSLLIFGKAFLQTYINELKKLE